MTNFGFHVSSYSSLLWRSAATEHQLSNMNWASTHWWAIALKYMWTWLLTLSVNSFSYMHSVLLVSGWSWWLYLSVTTTNLGDITAFLSFNTSTKPQIKGWCTAAAFEICGASLPLHCSSGAVQCRCVKGQSFWRKSWSIWSSASAKPSMDKTHLNIIH